MNSVARRRFGSKSPRGAQQRGQAYASLQCRGTRAPCRRAGVACHAFEVFSPSKVNLFLRILRRRPDGFHDLASLFHVISLGDTVSFEPRSGGEDALKCNWEDVPTDGSNLVLRALDLFRKHTGATFSRAAFCLPVAGLCIRAACGAAGACLQHAPCGAVARGQCGAS